MTNNTHNLPAPRSYDKWSAQDKMNLKSVYRLYPTIQIAIKLGRSQAAITAMASKLNLTK